MFDPLEGTSESISSPWLGARLLFRPGQSQPLSYDHIIYRLFSGAHADRGPHFEAIAWLQPQKWLHKAGHYRRYTRLLQSEESDTRCWFEASRFERYP